MILDGVEVDGIDTALRPSTIPIADVPALPQNRGIAFQGFLPGARYDITITEAERLLTLGDPNYSDVVKPYLDGRDITRDPEQHPARYTIDFGQMSLEEAMRYPAALDIVRTQAKEARESSTSYGRNPRWWQFLWPRPEFRAAIRHLPRFIAGTATAKRIFFVWCEPNWRPSNATNVFALADDYAIAVLSSSVHTEWARGRSSTLENRIRYTPTSAFETFPWPDPDLASRERIAEHGRALLKRRAEICASEGLGLTRLYNLVDDGGFVELAELDRELGSAVTLAYGWPRAVADDARESNARLLDLNKAIRAGDVDYEGPGGN